MAEVTSGSRVVFLDHTAALGGAELCLLDLVGRFPGAVACLFEDGPLVAELRARGVAVELLAPASSVAEVRRDDGWAAVLAAVPGVWRLVGAVARLTRPNDVLYANSQKSWIVAALVALRHRRKVIWHLHDILTSAHFGPMLARTAVMLANRVASAVVANSAATAEAFAAAGGRRTLVRVVHNGIDAAPFEAAAGDVPAPRRDLTIGLFGRIAPWKGQHVMLDALAELPDARLVVVGAPLFGEHEYYAELERRARTAPLAGRVELLGFRSDVAALMRSVDVVVHTSTSPEPFGRVIVEAQLARRPVVATAMGGVLEIVEHGVNGLLVPPGDASALAAAIRRLRADDALRVAVVAAGYRSARRFSVEAMQGAVADVVAAAAPQRPPRLVLVSHSAEPSGAELSLIDIAAYLGDDALVCLFQNGAVAQMLRDRGTAVAILEAPTSMLRLRSFAALPSVAAAVPAVLATARGLARIVREGDVLYANSQKAWIVTAIVAAWKRRPVVWHLRDILSAKRYGRAQRAAAVFLANRVATRVLVNSAATGAEFVAAGGRASLLRVVHNGIDEAPFAALREGLAEKSSLGRPVTVGLFGRLAHWKGQHVLLAALQRLDGVVALIVGDALFGEDDYRERLRALAAAPALAGRVHFLGHRRDVPELMKAVDIVVHTSIEPEPFGRVIVEGMLAERPVIATIGGGVGEIITDGVDGVLVPPNDPDALAAAIRALVADPERAKRLAAAGYKNARQRFALATMERRLAIVLAELVPSHPHKRLQQPCA